MESTSDIQTGTVLNDEIEFSLLQVCRICDVKVEKIVEMVEEGIIEPTGEKPVRWRFNGTMIKRVQITVSLQRDLDINLPGVAMVLDLLEELEELRQSSR